MKKFYTLLLLVLMATASFAQGWPAKYPGVMLQGFYWIEQPENATDAQKDSIRAEFKKISWPALTAQADELSEFFKLIWIPQSGTASGEFSMGYDPHYWFRHNSAFGYADDLADMIKAFKDRGTGVIADVVINHRMSLSANPLDFPNETYRGKDLTFCKRGESYKLTSKDICANDDGGTIKQWVDDYNTAQGRVVYELSSANDEGEDFSGGRDLDHTSANVQRCTKAYLDYLLNNLGYTGFRYDMVKGYSPYYVGLYNDAVKPTFSVGEFWDSNDATKNWMDGTRVNGAVQSGAFDFQLKWQLNSACAGEDWNALCPDNMENVALSWNSYWPRWAVTFVDNHDTYRDYACTKNALAANAYILSMPGTPCVFWQHWLQFKQSIKQMIYARYLAGINNQSGYEVKHHSQGCVSTRVDGKLEVLMGNGYGVYDASEGSDMTLVESGENYAIYLSKSVESPWVSLPSGSYEGPVAVKFTALSNSTDKMVYTLDGTDPTASSTQIQNNGSIMLNADATLKVGLLVGSTVKAITTRTYSITPGTEKQVTINVYAPNGAPYLYAWTEGGEVNGTWPGTQMSQTTTTAETGTTWYTATLPALGPLNIIFNGGQDQPQTGDITGLTEGTYYFTYDGGSSYKMVDESYVPGSEPVTLYVLGEADGNGWAPNVGVPMTTTDNVNFTATVTFSGSNDGYSYFSFTKSLAANSSDWAAIAPDRFGAESNDYLIDADNLGQSLSIRVGENAFKIGAGTFKLAVNLSQMTLTVTESAKVYDNLYIMGDCNAQGWYPNVGLPMTKTGENRFRADITLSGANDGYSYIGLTTRLAENDSDWDAIAPYRIGGTYQNDETDRQLLSASDFGTYIPLNPGAISFGLPGGQYSLSADLNQMTLVVNNGQATAISNVQNEQQNAALYDLQGRRILNKQPKSGVYMQNGKKIIIK